MLNTQAGYAGDEALSALLARNDINLDPAQVRAIAAGVAAAPVAHDPIAWQVLVGPTHDPALRTALTALLAQVRAELPDGRPRAERVDAIRAHFEALGVDGFLVPRADEHQGEYVPACAERLAWSTGFEGSAGLAAIMADRAVIFVDGRYTLQVKEQVDMAVFEQRHLHEEPLDEWILETLEAGTRLGFDPRLHTIKATEKLKKACDKVGAELVPVAQNPVDLSWTSRPPAPVSPVVAHPEALAGQSSADKRASLGEALKADAVVLTSPDSLAWLLNIRGADVPRAPLPLAFAILHRDGSVQLCLDPRKLAPGTRKHLGEHVSVHPPEALGPLLDELSGQKVQLDRDWASAWIRTRLEDAGATLSFDKDPCLEPKACKNEVELAGSRAAHVRDGASLTRFLCWLDRHAIADEVTELQAAAKVDALRAEHPDFRDLSFDTISGAGPNGAIVHYRVSAETSRRLEPGSLFLVDSGAQYPDGTTDVTRTVSIGEPTSEMRDRFTRVLKGHIALGSTRFVEGTSGIQLDVLARLPLWSVGLDYDHGTGHGVGSFLSVHEGPQRISKTASKVALKPGMIVSNEPGYYKAGEYGIRIENLVTVISHDELDGERPMLGFEELTLAPIDRRLVEVTLLSEAELAWLNAYHTRVRETLSPLLDTETATWLAEATAPLVLA